MTEFTRTELYRLTNEINNISSPKPINTRLFKKHSAEGIETVQMVYDFGEETSRDKQLLMLIDEFEVIFAAEVELLEDTIMDDSDVPFFGISIDPEKDPMFDSFLEYVKDTLRNDLNHFYKYLTKDDDGPYIGDMTYFFVYDNMIPLSKILGMAVLDPKKYEDVYIIKSENYRYNNEQFTAPSRSEARKKFERRCGDDIGVCRLKLKYYNEYLN